MKLAHIALWTNDLDAAAAFWRDHFGAAIEALYCSHRQEGFASRFATLPCGLQLELMAAPG
jgi:lactoylglutathione lyase